MKHATNASQRITVDEVKLLRQYAEGKLVIVYRLDGSVKEIRPICEPSVILEVVKS
jgi:hypothetical protein